MNNFGYANNSFGDSNNQNQMGFQNPSMMGSNQTDSFGMQGQSMNSFPMNSNNNMMQNQFMMGQNSHQMQEGYQFNNGFNSNNVDSSHNTMEGQMQQNNMGMMNQQNIPAEPVVSVYTTYENLPNYDEGIDLNQVAEQIKMLFADKAQWKPRFDAIDNLRILNKYHAKKMNEIISVFWNNILESFESQKTCIAKNILMFSTEVFMNAGEVRLYDECIQYLVPQVLNKSVSEKSVLKKEAETALQYLVSNCLYDVSLMTLCKCCFEKNPTVCEYALLALNRLVLNIGDGLPSLSFDALQLLMLTIGKVCDSAKKGNMKKIATRLCQDMNKRFGIENYHQLVMQTVQPVHPELVQYFAKAIEEKKDLKTRDSNLHDFIQAKKYEARMSNVGGFNSMQKMNSQNILGENFLAQQVGEQNHNYNQMNYMQNNQQQQQQNMMFQQNNGVFGNNNGFGFPQNF